MDSSTPPEAPKKKVPSLLKAMTKTLDPSPNNWLWKQISKFQPTGKGGPAASLPPPLAGIGSPGFSLSRVRSCDGLVGGGDEPAACATPSTQPKTTAAIAEVLRCLWAIFVSSSCYFQLCWTANFG